MSLAALDAALYAALAATQYATADSPTTAAPFALVGRYAGQLEEAGIQETCAQYPAALLRWDGGAPARTVDAVEGVEDVGVESWTVFVAVEEPREIDDAVAATSAQVPGALALVDCVLGALNGFVAAGLWRDRRVRAAGYGPALIKRGAVYVYSVRFEARRALPEAAMTAEQAGDGQDLTELGADVNLEGTADDPENPQNVLGITYL